MDDRGVLFEAAQDRLVARLSEAAADIDAVRDQLTPALTATPMPDLGDAAGRIVELAGRLEAMRRALEDSPPLDAKAAECVDRLERHVRAAAGETLAPDSIATVSAHLDKAYAAILSLLVPYHLEKALHRLRVGRSLLLADVLADHGLRMPSADDRVALLTRLERQDALCREGVIEPAHQRIWRKSANQLVKVATWAAPIAFAALAAGALWLVSRLGIDPKLEKPEDLLEGYALVLIGVAAHLVVENVKLFQAKTVEVLAIGSFADWVHLRWAGLSASLVPVLVTVIGLRLTVDDKDLTPLVYILAGYSIDNVAGVFLTRFGTAAASGVSKVNELIGAPPPAQSSS